MGGFRITPDYSVSDYSQNFKMLLLIGGYAWMKQKNNDIKPIEKIDEWYKFHKLGHFQK